jgi:hypothetical protein
MSLTVLRYFEEAEISKWQYSFAFDPSGRKKIEMKDFYLAPMSISFLPWNNDRFGRWSQC